MSEQTGTKKWCYVAVVQKDGYHIGKAERATRGYTSLDLGPYPTWEAARAHERELNRELGVTDREALDIVLETMRAD